MPDPMSSPANRALAAELRRLRDHAIKSGDDVAGELGWSASKLSRLETNKTAIKAGDLGRLLDFYQVEPGRRSQLIALASERPPRGWWLAYADSIDEQYQSYIRLEASARIMLWWSPELVNGLLQTQAYADEIMTMAKNWDRTPYRTTQERVAVRLRRQALLTEPDGQQFTFLLDEATLLRRHGTGEMMREQLEHLLEASRLPRVTIRVLAFAGQHPVINPGAFAILTFAPLHDTEVSDIVYTERLVSNEFVDDETSVEEYRLAFELLSQAALSPDESRDLIAHTIRERWS